MDEALELEIVDLGDAKTETKGSAFGMLTEDDPVLTRREI